MWRRDEDPRTEAERERKIISKARDGRRRKKEEMSGSRGNFVLSKSKPVGRNKVGTREKQRGRREMKVGWMHESSRQDRGGTDAG